MKKGILVFICLILFSLPIYAESIDESYIDLIFDKFADYSESIRNGKAEELKVFMEENARLDLLYTVIITTKSDLMAKYNISEADLKKNIDALKTWSALDRLKLVEAGASGDRSTVDALNAKYASENNTTPTLPTVPTIPSTPALPPSGYIPLDDEETPLAYISFKGVLKSSGFIYESIEVKEIGKTFGDVKFHWSKEYVNYLAERHIISGYNSKTFMPDANIKKSEIVALLMKLLVVDPLKLPEYSGHISDLDYNNWYDQTMKNAFTLGIIEPNYLGYIEPNHYSTREEVVDMIIRSIGAMHIKIDDHLKIYKSNFNDFDKVKSEFKESMTIAINLGFISGMGNNTIAPNKEITRGEIAVVVKKLYLYILDEINEEVTDEN
ncbi:MAG: S-layer homology domain-containing protein [Clostridia bacterium]|nr:S-layer homology domain-containing protein [Clostridia bacterium]